MTWNDEREADRIIVALDCPATEALDVAERLVGHARWVKVGMTLYYETGPSIVRHMHKLGFRVFVDLKLHDIPHQVNGAARSLAQAEADLITVHASGGELMMQAAVKGAHGVSGQTAPLVCAITVLTSMDDAELARVGVDDGAEVQVRRLSELAQTAGVDGIVCSPREARCMRAALGAGALIVTPGVRPHGSALGDQSRVATPAMAFAAGASHLVIGRPITSQQDPARAFDAIADSLR